MLVFNDEVLRNCDSTELATLLSVAERHGVVAQPDSIAANQEAIREFVKKRANEEAEDAKYTQELEARFT